MQACSPDLTAAPIHLREKESPVANPWLVTRTEYILELGFWDRTKHKGEQAAGPDGILSEYPEKKFYDVPPRRTNLTLAG